MAGARLLVSRLDGQPEGELRELAGNLVGRLGAERAAVVLGTAGEKGARLVAAVSKALAAEVNAKQLLEEAARAIGGGAGGRDTLAMAGGPRAERLDQALAGVPARLEALIAAVPEERAGPVACWASTSARPGSAWPSPTPTAGSPCRWERSGPARRWTSRPSPS